MRARRALLYMPGDDMHKIRKATTFGVDCICMDMEDGVAFNRKVDARTTIASALQSLDFGKSERLVRINSVGTGFESDDLAAVFPHRPDGIVIPKVKHADQINWISNWLSHQEATQGWKDGSVRLLAIVETALGIVNLPGIAAANSRLQGLIFGAEDLAGDIGAIRTAEAWEVFSARSAVVTHAAAFGLQAIDMVFVDFRDTAGLKRECEFGVHLGYSGKQVIHPNQIVPVQEAFTPDDSAIEHAQRLIEAYEHHQNQGQGAFAWNGKLVDAPIIKIAQQILTRARAAGKI